MFYHRAIAVKYWIACARAKALGERVPTPKEAGAEWVRAELARREAARADAAAARAAADAAAADVIDLTGDSD